MTGKERTGWFGYTIRDIGGPNCNQTITYCNHDTLLEYHWRYEYPKNVVYKCTAK